jgi:hypothetical protein
VRRADHLQSTYGIEVTDLSTLDKGVYRVDRRDGPAWSTTPASIEGLFA